MVISDDLSAHVIDRDGNIIDILDEDALDALLTEEEKDSE